MAARSFRLVLSPRGRIARSTYWFWSILVWVAFIALFSVLEAMLGRSSTLVLYPPFFWALFVLAAKRYHDLAKSPAWLLLLVIPVIGPLWVGIELGFRRGTQGENQFGTDPQKTDADYLTVA